MNTTARDRSRKPTTHGPPPKVGLSEAHCQHLATSAIDPAVSEERGTFTARRGRDVPQDGGKLPKKPGLVFPVHPLDSGLFHRLRPDNPARLPTHLQPNHPPNPLAPRRRPDTPGRLPKYLQPKDHPNRFDGHPRSTDS